MDNILKKQFSELKTYIPGRPIEQVKKQYGLKRVVKLASNESSLGLMPGVLDTIIENTKQLNRYPDSEATILREQISEFYGYASKNILIGNGSNELLRIAGQATLERGDEVIFANPSFVLYPMIAKLFEAKPVAVPLKDHVHDLEAMISAITNKTKLIFICNPNNPTGTMLSKKELDDFVEKVPSKILIVIDEAYAEFVEDKDNYPNSLSYIFKRPTIITRTFSKIYGLAGLRIGYGFAPASYVSVDKRVRDPFNVNLLAQAAAAISLNKQKEIERRYKINLEGKQYLYEGLDNLGLDYIQSQTNFVLVNLKQDSTIIFERLLRKGVIVRTGEIFGKNYKTYIRVSIGTKEETDLFLRAMKAVL